MSLHYIVDGYNVLMRSGRFERKHLKDARAAFLAHLEHCRPHGSGRNKLTVVFDGKLQAAGWEAPGMGGVVFTTGESADEKIKQMVERAQRPKDIVVVTDDKEIGFFVRRCGARLMATKDFLGKPGAKEPARAPDGLDAVQREKITEEMGRIWLKRR